jgi:uncharacterized protein with HEPN domain
MRSDDARLLDILLACKHARAFVKGLTQETFLVDAKAQAAVCMKLEVIGEAARAVSDECKAANPQVPWRGLVGLRNRIIHEYFRIDPEAIWTIVQEELPPLMALIAPLVPPEDQV